MNAAVAGGAIEQPVLFDELNRKTFETLEAIVSDHHAGRTTEAQQYAALTVLWGVCAGLVSRELMDLIATARDQVPKGGNSFVESFSVREPYVTKVRMVRWVVGSGVVELFQDSVLVKRWDFSNEVVPSKSAKALYGQLRVKLTEGI